MAIRDLIPWSRPNSTAPVAYQSQDNPVYSLRREVDRLFDDVFRSWPSPGSLFERGFGNWPSVELEETDREVLVTAEVPGLSEKDVELLVEDGVLTLRGERRRETEDKERGYSERFYGRFERRIQLPWNVDEKDAGAQFRDGVLTVRLPKSAEAERGRRIPINADTRH